MVSVPKAGYTQYCESTEEGAVNSPWRRLKMKATFELDITFREMHSGRVVRAFAWLPDEPVLKFSLYYLLIL